MWENAVQVHSFQGDHIYFIFYYKKIYTVYNCVNSLLWLYSQIIVERMVSTFIRILQEK